ncbi:MAG: hypothetical protein BGO01_02605 [Armatimonadetes bacterium 55-13]|nr:hypothetical protein [Armatimonadota bacterium]ODU54025.1 MAG: hypothetical protein ABT09_00465 [bacterium SCN 57-13]OJU62144.1 MAG: hypothetical protein BGO01_02605 [Armatimonadetes bacterium 55-13]
MARRVEVHASLWEKSAGRSSGGSTPSSLYYDVIVVGAGAAGIATESRSALTGRHWAYDWQVNLAAWMNLQKNPANYGEQKARFCGQAIEGLNQ